MPQFTLFNWRIDETDCITTWANIGGPSEAAAFGISNHQSFLFLNPSGLGCEEKLHCKSKQIHFAEVVSTHFTEVMFVFDVCIFKRSVSDEISMSCLSLFS